MGRAIRYSAIIILLLTGLMCSGPMCFANDNMRVAFINPDKKGNTYWDMVTEVMKQAAQDLGIQLDVIYENQNRFSGPRIISNLVNSPEKPDYLVHIFQHNQTQHVLEIAEKAGIKSFIFNTGITEDNRKKIGSPRGKYKQWIGHVTPNILENSKQLADYLIQQAKAKKTQGADGNIHVVGLSVPPDSSVATLWEKGLIEAVSAYDDVKLRQVLISNWNGTNARAQTKGLLVRYPEVSIVSVLGEPSLMRSVEGAEDAGRVLGRDIFMGASGLGFASFNSIEQGALVGEISSGIWSGSRVMVYLYDYHNGIDFSLTGEQIRYSSEVVDQDNIGEYKVLQEKDFLNKVDFRLFSKVLNPKIKDYDFSMSALEESTRGKQ